MIKLKQKKFNKHIASAILLFWANVIFFLTVWLLEQYDSICFDQFLYQLKSSTKGTDNILVLSGFLYMGGFGGLLTALEIFIYCLFTGRIFKKFTQNKISIGLNNAVVPLAVISLVCSVGFFIYKLNIIPYVKTATTSSQFIEENYSNPNEVSLEFPENKRNLVYIFAESMENTYASYSLGGQFEDNYIPELSDLAKQNINFSNTSGLGGAYAYDGTTWTASGMVAATSGVTVKVPINTMAYSRKNGFMQGVTTLGDILHKNGYNQTIIMGSDAEFANRDIYFTQHGNYKIMDVNSLKADEKLPKDYNKWWGFEDEKLFEFAKRELTRLSAENKPFNLTLLTADSHFPNGYVCDNCEDTYEVQYSNVIRCSSSQINDFVNWIKKQPFYQNTTIIISGDHLTMDPKFMSDVSKDYKRTVYNCIINPAVEPKKEKQREFATFDMFPTTLASIGVRIEGDRLGLGTNLFSNKPTLTEEYGFNFLNKELSKKSGYYNKNILYKE